MDIETKHASLDTLSVTIQALHVNGKQMTLAVFRQLPILETGDRLADAQRWGYVLYPIKDQGDEWIIYSLEGHLYRRACQAYPLESYNLRCTRTDLVEAQKAQAYGGASREQVEALTRRVATLEKKDNTEHAAARQRWVDDCQLKNVLPQLFIAV